MAPPRPPKRRPNETRESPMPERSGLSIFDDTEDATETTQVAAVAPTPAPTRPTPAPAPAAQTPPASQPSTVPGQAATGRGGSGFPLSRRGYDTGAVDRRVAQLASDNTSLARE